MDSDRSVKRKKTTIKKNMEGRKGRMRMDIRNSFGENRLSARVFRTSLGKQFLMKPSNLTLFTSVYKLVKACPM